MAEGLTTGRDVRYRVILVLQSYGPGGHVPNDGNRRHFVYERAKEQQDIIMATTLYGIADCDTIKKARKWLERQGVT